MAPILAIAAVAAVGFFPQQYAALDAGITIPADSKGRAVYTAAKKHPGAKILVSTEEKWLWFVVGFFEITVGYLTAAWWISGRTVGDHVMGIRVVTGKRTRLRVGRAFVRAVLCAAFPVGLLWCVISRERRAVHDVLLRTSVVYDWLPRPARSLPGATVPQP